MTRDGLQKSEGEDQLSSPQNEQYRDQPPIFNLPPIIVWIASILGAIHVVRIWLVPDQYALDFILLFAAIPARYGDMGALLPYTFAAWYTPVSYALVHADWTHLLLNLAMTLAFGSPVAKRLGPVRFILFAFVGVLAGFGFHLAAHINEFGPMIGASGAVSAFIAAAIRLQRDVTKPVLSLVESFKNRGFIAFVVIWFLMNLLIGINPEFITGGNSQIAWQAHIGGFLAGLLLFRWFDAAQILKTDNS